MRCDDFAMDKFLILRVTGPKYANLRLIGRDGNHEPTTKKNI